MRIDRFEAIQFDRDYVKYAIVHSNPLKIKILSPPLIQLISQLSKGGQS